MTSLPFIPFVRGQGDEDIFCAHYSDAPFVRVCLNRKVRIGALTSKTKLWIDTGIDGVANAYTTSSDDAWKNHIKKHGDLSALVDPVFLTKPIRKKIESSIQGLLSEAAEHSPAFLSVPQLPYEEGPKHNKINRLLAEITADWRKGQTSVRLILPVILTEQHQLNSKTQRNPIIKQAANICTKFGFDAVWSVDHSLEDQAGTGNFERLRFPGIIDFFTELKKACSLEITVAGPYWGLGLVLWSRGLVSHFGIGMGSSYRYHLPGGVLMGSKARIAIGPLRRWASSSNATRDWLHSEQAKLSNGSPEQAEMKALHAQYPNLLNTDIAKRQVARIYRTWLDKIVTVPSGGRAVALYQDLSAAFVTGKMLDDLPDEAGLARKPERVAEQLMLNCL